jgi:SMC interacting uncharacterized protein involved in chromosome segregation
MVVVETVVGGIVFITGVAVGWGVRGLRDDNRRNAIERELLNGREEQERRFRQEIERMKWEHQEWMGERKKEMHEIQVETEETREKTKQLREQRNKLR